MTSGFDRQGMLDELRRAGLLETSPSSAGNDRPFSAVTVDSRAIAPGAVYIAVRGSQTDGHRFVSDALARGAGAAVVESPQGSDPRQIVVRDSRRAALALGQLWYGHPARSLSLIGVTGTNGKTTTAGLTRHLLNQNRSAASIGTLGAFDGHGRAVESTAGSLTTPGPIDLQATLRELADRATTHVAMEASSHSLDQGRLDGLSFAAAVYTNLTRDHLDYHGNMESYLAAKLKLSGLLANGGIEIVNADDRAWDALPRATRRLTFGVSSPADVAARGTVLSARGSQFRLITPSGQAEATLPLLGDFNVANALAAAATALALGRPLEEVVARLAESPQVPGRMEQVASRPCIVLRDYAHTPDALERALGTLRPLTTGRLIAVFGCGGDRDKGKRPLMGRIAATLADLAVVTSDNPRTENPEAIIDDIEQGMGGSAHLRISDRLAAIHAALDLARPGDTLLLAGKGHETYQIIGTERLPFDERELVRQALGLDAAAS